MLYILYDFQKQNTFTVYVGYALYFYFSGLSLSRTAMKDYQIALSNEITFQSEIGFRNINQGKYYQKERRWMNLLLMKL
jgi:hypothetical protein